MLFDFDPNPFATHCSGVSLLQLKRDNDNVGAMFVNIVVTTRQKSLDVYWILSGVWQQTQQTEWKLFSKRFSLEKRKG